MIANNLRDIIELYRGSELPDIFVQKVKLYEKYVRFIDPATGDYVTWFYPFNIDDIVRILESKNENTQ